MPVLPATALGSKLSIAVFAPVAPASSGIADYAATLAAALAKQGNVTVNPNEVPKNGVALYHLGNNQLHRDIYQRALAHPGVIVLHDAVLTHFFLGSLAEDAWISEFVYNYGEWTRGFAQELWANRSRSGADPRYFEYPMLKRIAQTARAIIVHNPAAARAVLRHFPQATVVEIPHFFDGPTAPLPPPPSQNLRAGIFGYLRESKRLPAIIRAWKRSGIDLELVMAGSFASADLERTMLPMLEDPRIQFHGRVSDVEFWRIAQSVDVCVNLRYPTAGETSGIGVRLMGLGKTAIFTEGEEISRIPEDACLRVVHGSLEEETLAAYFVWINDNREAAKEIGQRAAAHIAHEHSLESVAQRYREVLAALGS